MSTNRNLNVVSAHHHHHHHHHAYAKPKQVAGDETAHLNPLYLVGGYFFTFLSVLAGFAANTMADAQTRLAPRINNGEDLSDSFKKK